MKKTAWLTILFGAEAILIEAVGIPFSFNFDMWAFMDSGSNLTAQYLTHEGYRPTIDFGYIYGLLPLLVDRLWFGVAGASPFACIVMVTACNLLIAWAIARFMTSLDLGTAGIVFICITLPYAIQANYPTTTHALEAALLANGLAAQASGKRATALVLSTLACFTKPSMGYVYGALLLGFEALTLSKRQPLDAFASAFARRIAAAAVTSIAAAAALASTYGAQPLLRNLLPTAGMRAYQAMYYGFFGAGRHFWYFPGVHVGYYAGTVVGFWLVGTLWLAGRGAIALVRTVRDFNADAGFRREDEIVVSCAIMHLAFVMLFFGNAFSWPYYSYVLVMGIAATGAPGGSARYAIWSLALIALVGQTTYARDSYKRWILTAPTRATMHLWASPDESAEWQKVLTLLRTDDPNARPAALLARTGCAELLFPEFAKPVSLYLDPDIPTDEEVQREAAQLRRASAVVVVRKSLLVSWPSLDAALAGRTLALHGKFFDVYR